MVNFPTWISDFVSDTAALLSFFLSSDTSICSTMAFLPFENSDHLIISFSVDCPLNSNWDAALHCKAYDYSPADWDGFCDNLRDVPWRMSLKPVLLLLLVTFVSGFRLELMYISLIVNIMSSLTNLHGFQLLVLLPYFL